MRNGWIAIMTVLLLYSCGETAEKSINRETSEGSEEHEEATSDTVYLSDMNDSLAVLRSSTNSPSRYRVVPLFDPQTGWGYDILDSNRLLIHQPHIPAVQGLRGFKSKDDAIKVAQEVAWKLQRGIMPPTLSEDEMRTLGVL